MNDFKQSVEKVLRGAFQAVSTFPAASLSGLLFTLTTMVRIQMDWPQEEKYQLLFNSIHWSFGLGAVFGLMAVTYLRGRKNQGHLLGLANGVTGIVSLLSFLALYFLGQINPTPDSYLKYPYLSNLANARMSILIGILFLAFILFAARPKEKPNLSRSVFMVQKALVVTGIYGLVLLGGTSAVAGAIQGLLFPSMSFKVYQYLGSIIAFVTFLLFLGYLPDFSKDESDEKRQEAENQSKFMHLLFSYILVPITLALTVVLLLWAVKIMFQGVGDNFLTLSGISTSYAVIGIWLHLMVQDADNKLARFYVKVYPIATLLILAFEGWALVTQLRVYGMQTTEYYFVLVWIVAVTAMIFLLWKKQRAYQGILVLLMAAMLFTVLPVVGYQSLPIRLQTQRLEKLLVEAKMWQENEIVPGSEELARPLREKITLSAQFLARQENKDIPTWLRISAYDTAEFTKVMGFAPIRPRQDSQPPIKDETRSTNLRRADQALAIEDFDWRLALNYNSKEEGQVAYFEGKAGAYQFQWLDNSAENKVPHLKVTLNEEVIIDESLTTYIEELLKAHPPIPTSEQLDPISVDTLQIPFASETIEGIFVFNGIEIRIDPTTKEQTCWIDVEGIYLIEK